MAERKKLGDLLVEGKVISPMQLQSALAHQRQWGGRLGSALIEKGFVTDDVLAKFLSFQLNVPSVNLSKVQVSVDVIDKIPRDMREKHLCSPIAVMKEGSRETVIVAMVDPTDLRAVDEIGFATGLKVKPVIATELALKRFVFGENAGLKTFRNVAKGAEGTEDFEMDVVQGSVDGVPLSRAVAGQGQAGLAPGSMAPIGESTIDLEPEEFELSPVIPPAMPAAAMPAAAKADPFLAAVRANASGAPLPAGFREDSHDDQTEPELELSDVPPSAPESAPADVAPHEGLMQDAWGDAVVATGVMPAEDSVPEISLPGPESLTADPASASASEPGTDSSSLGEDGEFGFAIPSDLEIAEGTNGFFAATAPSVTLPEPEPDPEPEPAAESAPEPQFEPEAEPPLQPEPEPEPAFDAAAESTVADPFPTETWEPAPSPDAAATYVPVTTTLDPAVAAEESDPADMERTQLGQGAFEATWTGADELSSPPSPRTPERSRTIESPIPPPAPPAVAVKPITPGARAGDEQATLNATIAKKLKLLNAIAELLLEKGLITEDEIRDKISRKK